MDIISLIIGIVIGALFSPFWMKVGGLIKRIGIAIYNKFGDKLKR